MNNGQRQPMPNRELALEMWAAGKAAWDICDAAGYSEPKSLCCMVFYARKRGDARAAKRKGGCPATRTPDVLRLSLEGLSRERIARKLGCSIDAVNTARSVLRKRGDLPPVIRDRAWSSLEHERLKRAAASGESGGAIAQTLGRSRGSVVGRAHRTGIHFLNGTGGQRKFFHKDQRKQARG